MTIDEFVAYELASLMKYKQYYAEHTRQYPDSFPATMAIEDWIEDYNAYVSVTPQDEQLDNLLPVFSDNVEKARRIPDEE